jgi:hypothetical protein
MHGVSKGFVSAHDLSALKFAGARFVPAKIVSAPIDLHATHNVKQFPIMSQKENPELLQAIPDMVRDLVRRADRKLAELEARKQYLRRRVQALRFLATHAAQKSSAERPHNLASGQSSSAHDLNRSEHDVKRARADRDSGTGTTTLRRACRIALMESDEPQTSKQIYQRICKRGSLSFQSSTDALHVLSAELDLMAKESEITYRVLDGEKRWQRPFSE